MTDIDEAMVISFLGVRIDRQKDGQTDRRTDRQTDRQTDTVLESSHGNMSAHKKFQLKAVNTWLTVDPYIPPRRTGMHKNVFKYHICIELYTDFVE